jgi:hypothetical protein
MEVDEMVSVQSVLRGIVIVAGNAVGLIDRPDGRHRQGRATPTARTENAAAAQR